MNHEKLRATMSLHRSAHDSTVTESYILLMKHRASFPNAKFLRTYHFARKMHYRQMPNVLSGCLRGFVVGTRFLIMFVIILPCLVCGVSSLQMMMPFCLFPHFIQFGLGVLCVQSNATNKSMIISLFFQPREPKAQIG